jgi:hypothetical protein
VTGVTQKKWTQGAQVRSELEKRSPAEVQALPVVRRKPESRQGK